MIAKPTLRWSMGLVALLALVAAGCSGSDSATSTAGMGQVKVEMGTTSAVAASTTGESSATLSSLEVTVESLRAQMADGTWQEIAGAFPQTVDVLALSASGEITLGAGLLPAGSYSALEVVISRASATLSDGTTITVDFPAPGRTVFLAVGFEVVEGQETFLDLHLDLELSVKFDGVEFEFEPEFEVEVDDHDD